jgi:hypothetical protein
MGAMTAQSKSSAYALRAPLAALSAALSAALLLAACAASTASNPPSASASTVASSASLDAAISGPQRADKARERDIYRHPKETLQFFELAPSQTVLEIAPGGGWYTEILAPYLHDCGTLYEAEYDGRKHRPAAPRLRANWRPRPPSMARWSSARCMRASSAASPPTRASTAY